MSQQQNQPPPSRPSNPFGSSGNRPFGSSAPPARPGGPPAAPPAPAPSPAPPRPFGGLSRFGANRTDWRIISVFGAIVRFDLNGLGDPFHRLLGQPLAVEYGNYEAAIKAIEAGGDLVAELGVCLDAAWPEYRLHGAVLLYPWRKELPQVMVGPVTNNDDDDDETVGYDDEKPAPPVFLRALDVGLVLNVLARTRANILLGSASLGLERQYLAQSLYSDDPRLIALARATGCIEEAVIK